MITYKQTETDNKKLSIVYDNSCEDPREWSDLTNMICWHNMYQIGDQHNYEDSSDFILDVVYNSYEESEISLDDIKDFVEIKPYEGHEGVYYVEGVEQYIEGSKEELKDIAITDPIGFMSTEGLWKLALKKHVIMPIYLYDHSGISISTAPFHCAWDSGQIGWIIVSKEDMQKNHIEDINGFIEQSVEVYNYYLKGQVFSLICETKSTCPTCKKVDYTFVDSFGGFYGEPTADEIEQVIPHEFGSLVSNLA